MRALRGRAAAMVRFAYKHGEAVVIERDLVDGAPIRDEGRVSVVPIVPDHMSSLDTLGADGNAESARRRIRNYVELGYRGYLAMCDGTAIGYGWWVDASFPSERLHPAMQQYRIVLQPGELYAFEIFVAPQFRGMGMATAFMQATLQGWLSDGYRRAIGFVDARNLAARTLYRMTGWTDTRRCVTHTLFKRLLVVDGQVFLRNRPSSRPHSFDYRLVYSRKPAATG